LLAVGERLTLVATVHPADVADKTVIWSSSDEDVAKVVNGAVTAISVGAAVITVAAKNSDKKATCVITVAKIMNMTTDISGEMTVSLAGSGEASIIWGDDTRETFLLSDTMKNYSHRYSDAIARTITGSK